MASFSLEDLSNAMDEYQSEGRPSMRSLARKYDIPKSTLHDHLKGKSKQVGAGGPTVLSEVQRYCQLK